MGSCPVAGTFATPMLRALVSAASFFDFSKIAFCFSSSLARMLTRSSGMGLLSLTRISDHHQDDDVLGHTLKLWLNLISSAIFLSISLLTMAWRLSVRRCFSPCTNSRKAASAAGYES